MKYSIQYDYCPGTWQGLQHNGMSKPWNLSWEPAIKQYFPFFGPIKKIGNYALFGFETPDKKTALFFRLGRKSESEWIFQIFEQDERFRIGEDTDVGYVATNHMRISSWNRPHINVKKNIIFLRGDKEDRDFNIVTFKASVDQIKEMLCALLDWSQNWEGWYK